MSSSSQISPGLLADITIDEPAYLVWSYTLSFSPFYHFLFITDTLPCNTPTWHPVQHLWAIVTACTWHLPSLVLLPVAPSDWLHIWNVQVTYRPCCYISLSWLVPVLILWWLFLFSAYWFTTVIHDGSAQLPNSPCCRPTGLKSLCHMVSESGGCCCFAADDPCVHFFHSHFVFKCLYFLHTTEMFSPRVWT